MSSHQCIGRFTDTGLHVEPLCRTILSIDVCCGCLFHVVGIVEQVVETQ